MTSAFTRAQILDRLHASVRRQSPILIATAGNGLIARSLEAGGTDLILTAGTSVSRQRGMPSLGWGRGQNNRAVREVIDQVGGMVRETPLIAQVDAGEEPADGDLGALVDELVGLGYSGLLDHPVGGGSLGGSHYDEARNKVLARGEDQNATAFLRQNADAVRSLREYAEEKERTGRGYARDVELVGLAHERDIFTLGVVWTAEQAAAIVEAGADVLVGHCGGTSGGAAGAAVTSYEEAAGMLREQFDAARSVRPDVLLFGHGGPFGTAEDAVHMYELTDAVGFLAGSAVERTAVELAVQNAVHAFKAPVPDLSND